MRSRFAFAPGRFLLAAVAVGLLIFMISGGLTVYAHGGDPDVVHICVKTPDLRDSSQPLYLGDTTDDCKAGFDPLHISILGPTGPSGPSGEKTARNEEDAEQRAGIEAAAQQHGTPESESGGGATPGEPAESCTGGRKKGRPGDGCHRIHLSVARCFSSEISRVMRILRSPGILTLCILSVMKR